MRSGNTEYLERLDHLRFVAAALVLLFHAKLLLGAGRPADAFSIPLIDQGHFAVQLFMVISGFILGVIAHGKEINAARFYWNRALRIYPLFVTIVALGYFSTPDPRPSSTALDFLVALLPISNLSRLVYGPFGGHLWSIAVELQFYLLFPLFHRLISTWGPRPHLLLIGFLVVLRAMLYALGGTVHHFAYFSLFGALDVFLIGHLAGVAYREKRVALASSLWSMGALALLSLALWGLFSPGRFFHVDPSGSASKHWLWIIWPDLIGGLSALLVLSYLQGRFAVPLSRLWGELGRWSYSIYGWHILVIALTPALGFSALSPYGIGVLVVLPLTIAVAGLSFYALERPFLSMRVVYTSPRQAQAEIIEARRRA